MLYLPVAAASCSIYLSTYLPIYLSTYLPIYLSTYLPVPTAYLFCASILLVYPFCLSFLSILHVYASCSATRQACIALPWHPYGWLQWLLDECRHTHVLMTHVLMTRQVKLIQKE